MADISKINAVLIANIAEIDDVLAANIAKVNGLVFSTAPAFTGLLDTYTGAAAAYSVRRLNSLYTGALLRVRRDTGGGTGDDDEADVAYDSNNELSLDSAISNASAGVTATTFGEFVAASGYSNPDSLTGTIRALVPTWYGQETSGGTGAGNDATEDTATQAEIYDGTAINLRNGSPVLKPTNTTNYALASLDLASANTFFYVGFADRDGKDVLGMATYPLYRMSNGSTSSCTFGYSPAPVYFHNGVEQSTTPTRDEAYDFMSAQQRLLSSVFGDRAGTNMFIGGQTTYMIEAQELIIWKSDQDTAGNRSGIEGNVNAHFQIGNFGTPTSGLLYDYSGAAAAYSVRQLANTAALAMRVREDGTDTETDIGFDSNGDLDTAAIATHCGANNGYVVTWYDQSGEQLDATQTTNANQPQIYDGSMINLNGKPLVKATRGGGLAAGFNLSLSLVQAFTVVSVGEVGNLNAHLYADSTRAYWMRPRDAGLVANSGSTLSTPSTYTHSGQIFTAYIADGSSSYVEASSSAGSVNSTGNSGTVDFSTDTLLNRNTYDRAFAAQEVIFWNTDQGTTNIAGIESNINNYFSIY